MASSLDVIIVNWNAGDWLRTCLRSLAEASRADFTLKRVVVVDNASADDSCRHLDGIPVPLSIIVNRDNRGFAAACNQGAAGSTTDYLLFLNPDTQVSTDALTRSVSFLDESAHADVGICGVRIVDEDGLDAVSCARFPTLADFVGHAFGLTRLWPSAFPPIVTVAQAGAGAREVDQVIGAFFLVRRALFEELGGFDERFFMYFEELDFSLRARQRNCRSMLLTDVCVRHSGGFSSAQVPAARLFYSLRSRLLYGVKHYSRAKAALLKLVTLVIEPLSRTVRALVRRSGSELREVVVGHARLVAYWARGGLSGKARRPPAPAGAIDDRGC